VIRLDLPSGWAEHMTADVGALRWVSLPAHSVTIDGRRIHAEWDPCPGCVDGRPLVEVTVPCDCTHLLHDDPPYGWECPDCVCDDGRVSLGRWVADLPAGAPLRVVSDIDPAVIEGEEWPAVTVDPITDATYAVVGPALVDMEPIALPDPAARVGEYAIRCRKVGP